MNADLLSGLLGGVKGNNMMLSILPLLLGGRGGGGDIGKLLSSLDPSVSSLFGALSRQGTPEGQKEDDFPPLFGASSSPSKEGDGGLAPLLSSLFQKPAPTEPGASSQKANEYPYELQYNHPEPKENYKK